MNEKFDELAKGLAQSDTRRGALKKFGLSLAGAVLASLGLANQAEAVKPPFKRNCDHCNPATNYGCSLNDPNYAACYNYCNNRCNPGGGY